jgi:hypothetical protein
VRERDRKRERKREKKREKEQKRENAIIASFQKNESCKKILFLKKFPCHGTHTLKT